MASGGGATAGRPDRDGYEWDARQRECQRSVCVLTAYPRGGAELSQDGTGWVVRNDAAVAALVTARHVLQRVLGHGRLTGVVTATFPDGQRVSLSGACVLSAPVPGAAAEDPSLEMDAVVVRLAPGRQFPAPPVPCALAATLDADGAGPSAGDLLVQQGATCTLLHHPRGHRKVVVTPRGAVVAVRDDGGQPWRVTHNLESDKGSSGGMLIDAQCRAFAIHGARQASDVKHAVLVSALHVGLGPASPWRGAPPVVHGRAMAYGLPPRCGNFVGRVDDLAALTRTVKGGGTVVVVSTGLPGVGKSTMVSEWAHRTSLLHEFGAVFWLRADTVDNLCDDLVGLGEKLRMPLGMVADRSMTQRAAFVKQQLDRGAYVSGVALLVFDNADDYAAVRDFVPTGRDCRVVFTARDRLTYGGHRVLPLEPLAAQESMELLSAIIARRIEGDETAAANALCAEVGHLPLAVEQLALYAKESGASLASVLLDVRQSAASAGPLDNITLATYERRASVVGALQLVQRQLSQPGRRLLQRLALLAPERVPRELLGPDADATTPELSSLAMVSYPAVGLVSAHRLVLRVALDGMSDTNGDLLRATGDVVAALAQQLVGFDPDDAGTWGSMRAILPHAAAFVNLKADTSVWMDEIMAKQWLGVLKMLYAYNVDCIRDYVAAHRWANQRMKDGKALFYGVLPLYLGRNVDLAWVLALRGLSIKAQVICGRVQACVEKHLVEQEDPLAADDHDNVIKVAMRLAKTLRVVQLPKEALRLLKTLHPVAVERYGEESTVELVVRAELALLLQQMGKVDQAVPMLEDVLRVAEATTFPVSFILYQSELARMYMRDRKTEAALHLYTLARDKSAAVLGEEHFQVARAEHQMGLVARELGQLDEAEKLFRESLRKQLILGDGSPNVDITRRALAGVLFDQQFIRTHKQRRAASADEEALLDAAGDGDARNPAL